MANNNPDSESLDLKAETTESRSASESQKSSAASPPLVRNQASNTQFVSLLPSTGNSPRTSRNASPTRREGRQQSLTTPIATQPSAAAIQRALSAANVPHLQAGGVADGVSKLPKAPKSAGGGSGDNTPRWPTSPRLKSPPPGSSSRRGSALNQQKTEGSAAPSIHVQNATPQTSSPPPLKQGGDETTKAQQIQTPKGSSRGPSGKSILETVQENSLDDRPPSPAAIRAAAELKPLTKFDDANSSSKRDDAGGEDEKHTQQGESGSESAGTKSDKKTKDQESITQRPKNAHTKSYTPLSNTKSRQQEGKQNMTVETETVASIPQSALSAGDRSGGNRNESGSIRNKPSSETIRPKKERKKTSQKTRSINQGTGTYLYPKSPLLTQQVYFEEAAEETGAESSRSSSTTRELSSRSDPSSPAGIRHLSYSQHFKKSLSFRRPSQFIRSLSNRYLRKASSKADIFEARVANAVDEANSSDSDETYVYESNPPEPQRRALHHSRTPSVTSSHSAADGQRSAGMRTFGDVLEDRRVAGKRSMKFSNNAFNDIDSPESKDGSVRSHQPRHFGRFGRGGSQASMYDPDSPFTQASKLRSNQLSVRHSRPNSPRSPYNGQPQKSSGLFGKKQEPSFDFDAEGGDDERAPLIGTVRTPRSGRLPRRLQSSGGHSIDGYFGVRRQSRCGRIGGCFLGLVVFAAVILSAIAFLVMSNRPMYDVEVLQIQNVLASEQELILDLLVGAVNPNALGIDVTAMNVDIFAKSKHVGTGEFWRNHGHAPLTSGESIRDRRKRSRRLPQHFSINARRPWGSPSPSDNVDEGTDPPDDDDLEKDAQTMLLGRVLDFDQGLSFEGSPLKRHMHNATGELKLEKPGNRTETGGSDRWEKVIQYPFELIIRGVLKYQLPISSRLEAVKVNASVMVQPEDGVDGFGSIGVKKTDRKKRWEWIEWEDA